MARPPLSPLVRLLAALFFSAHALAVSAVLGIDLGTEYLKAALVKPGIPLEIVLTKDSRRKEISAVAFKPLPDGPKAGEFPERFYGSDAMALAPRYPSDVYPNLKTLLGLPIDSAGVKEYAMRNPALRLEAHKPRGTPAFKSSAFTADEGVWLVEELLAMKLQSVQSNAESLAGSGSSVRSVVITVPPFYTIEENRAVKLAADLAGLRVLSLISDGLAVGLDYATSRQFPHLNDSAKPEYNMVFDMGAGSTKATIMKFQSRTIKDVGRFNKTIQEVQVVGAGWDRTLGGDSLNSLIVDDMIAQFADSPKAKSAGVSAETVKTHGRAMARLSKEAERLRHILSANQAAQTSFEGLYDDIDFKYKISRANFETMATEYAERLQVAIRNAFTMATLSVEDLNSVILHGGATRTPFVQEQVQKVLGLEKIRTNVNSDESAVFGAGFRAAELSPSFRVKEIRAMEGSFYPAGMKWSDSNAKPQRQQLWKPNSLLGGPALEVTFKNQEDFEVTFFQEVPVAGYEGSTGSIDQETKAMTTKNLTSTIQELGEKHSCEKTDVQLKVSLRLSSEDGEVQVTRAVAECETEDPEKEGIIGGVKNLLGLGKKGQQPLAGGDEAAGDAEPSPSSLSAETSSGAEAASSATADTALDAGQLKKRRVSIPVEVVLGDRGIPTLSKMDLLTSKGRLKAFGVSDRSRRLREEALNQLEGYTYKARELLDSEDFVAISTAEEREAIGAKATEAGDWIYGDGADAPRDAFAKRLKELEDMTQPIQARAKERSERPGIVEDLQRALDLMKKSVDNYRQRISEYAAFQSAHPPTPAADAAPPADKAADEQNAGDAQASPAPPDPGPIPPFYTLDDIKILEDLRTSISTWLDQKLAEQEKLEITSNPVLLVKDLKRKRGELDKANIDFALKAAKSFEIKSKKAPPKPVKVKASGPKKVAVDGQADSGEQKADGSAPPPEETPRGQDSQGQGAERAAGRVDGEESGPKHEEL